MNVNVKLGDLRTALGFWYRGFVMPLLISTDRSCYIMDYSKFSLCIVKTILTFDSAILKSFLYSVLPAFPIIKMIAVI